MADKAIFTPYQYHDYQSRRQFVVFSFAFSLVLSTVSVGLRLVCKRMTRNKMYLDDYLILVALLFKYTCTCGAIGMLYHGLGRHVWMVAPDRLTTYMKIVFSGTFSYTFCITFIKLSILSFYKRLFPVKPMVISVYVTGAIVVLWCVCITVSGGFICVPIQKLWDPMLPGGCIELAKYYYGLQVPNIVTDGMILVMPVRTVWGLHMPKFQKLLICGIFMVGAVTLIFDVIRLIVMIELSENGPDFTYNQAPASAWTCLEACVGIMAACLPSMRPLATTFTNRVWSKVSTPGNSRKSKQSEGNSSNGKGSKTTGSNPSKNLASQ